MSLLTKQLVRGLWVLAAAAVLFASGLIGWSLHTQPKHDVKVTDTFTGTLSNLNIDHNSGCIQSTGKHVCGAFLSFDPTTLHDGQSVQIASESHTTTAGNGVLLLVVVPTSGQVD